MMYKVLEKQSEQLVANAKALLEAMMEAVEGHGAHTPWPMPCCGPQQHPMPQNAH